MGRNVFFTGIYRDKPKDPISRSGNVNYLEEGSLRRSVIYYHFLCYNFIIIYYYSQCEKNFEEMSSGKTGVHGCSMTNYRSDPPSFYSNEYRILFAKLMNERKT